MGCIKILLIVLNILVFLIGAACIGVGAWIYTEDETDIVQELTGEDWEAGSFILIAGGAGIVLVSLLGACGAKTENRFCLATYFLVCLICLVAFVVVAVLVVAFRETIEDEMENQMRKKIEGNYGIDKGITDLIDEIQEEYKCCGVSGGLADGDSWFIWQRSSWVNSTDLLPASCCSTKTNLTACQQLASNSSMPPQTVPDVTAENPYLYGEGCVHKIFDEFEDNIWVAAGVAGGAFVIILFAVLASLYLCTFAGRDEKKESA